MNVSASALHLYTVVDKLKEHKSVILIFLFTSFGFVGYRTYHFFNEMLGVPFLVSLFGTVTVEFTMLAVYSALINLKFDEYYTYLMFGEKSRDYEIIRNAVRSMFGVFYIVMTMLVVIAFYDAFILSQNTIAGLIFAALQIAMVMVYTALLALSETKQRKIVVRKVREDKRLLEWRETRDHSKVYCTCKREFDTVDDLARHVSYFKNKGDNSHMEDR